MLMFVMSLNLPVVKTDVVMDIFDLIGYFCLCAIQDKNVYSSSFLGGIHQYVGKSIGSISS